MRLSDKEMEALLFMMDDEDSITDALPFAKVDVLASLERLVPLIELRELPLRLGEIDRAMVKYCIEDSTWPACYVQFAPTDDHIEEARATLRQLARRLAPLGIEVDRIAYA